MQLLPKSYNFNDDKLKNQFTEIKSKFNSLPENVKRVCINKYNEFIANPEAMINLFMRIQEQNQDKAINICESFINFIIQEVKIAEIRKASRMVAQICRSSVYRSISIPDEIGVKIASMVTDSLTEKEAVDVASKYYGRPVIR